MMRTLTAALLAALAFASAARAQSRRPINGVRAWKGSVKMSMQGAGSITYGNAVDDWAVDSGGQMQVRVEWDERVGWYSGTILSGRATVRQRRTTTIVKNVATSTWTAEADLGPGAGEAREYAIGVERNGTFYFQNLGPFLDVRVVHPGNSFTTLSPWDHGEVNLVQLTPPANATRLQGSFEAKGQAFFLVGNNVQPDLKWKVEYDLQPDAPAEELEVKVTSATYQRWRPTAGIGGTRGAPIAFTATLQTAAGGEPTVRARTFEWSFPAMSREPGYAMNMPSRDAQRTPDMRFESSATLEVAGSEAQSAQAVAGRLLTSEAVIAPYDWGGYGALEVVAVLEDGRRITGRLDGASPILLPRRAPGDPIALAWREARGVTGKPAAADDENFPVGDGNRGDGLTLYEEYRGFIENGLQVEGSVERKDLFLYNAARVSIAGIVLFRQLSQLDVHFDLTAEEAGDDRVMNRNVGAAPHLVAQHLVEIVWTANANATAHSAVGGPGNPVMIKHVALVPLSGAATATAIADQARTVAHELFHAVNVWHHGDHGDRKVFWVQRDGEVFETVLDNLGRADGPERKITVLDESGLSLNLEVPSDGVVMYVGGYGGPHSGVEDCVMRYQVSSVSVSSTDTSVRYWVNETPGQRLCRQRTGTGVNAPEYRPESRYGDAAANRGDCAHQILVNDAVIALRRH